MIPRRTRHFQNRLIKNTEAYLQRDNSYTRRAAANGDGTKSLIACGLVRLKFEVEPHWIRNMKPSKISSLKC